MIIEVSQALLDLISKVEEREREAISVNLNFNWAYSADGFGATGEAFAYNPHAEFDLYVSKSGEVSAQRREVGKYDNEGWETDPFDSEYEEEQN